MEPAKLQQQYPRLADFKTFLKQQDPQGKFRNEFIQDNLFAT
jgi:alditol oxidase